MHRGCTQHKMSSKVGSSGKDWDGVSIRVMYHVPVKYLALIVALLAAWYALCALDKTFSRSEANWAVGVTALTSFVSIFLLAWFFDSKRVDCASQLALKHFGIAGGGLVAYPIVMFAFLKPDEDGYMPSVIAGRFACSVAFAAHTAWSVYLYVTARALGDASPKAPLDGASQT